MEIEGEVGAVSRVTVRAMVRGSLTTPSLSMKALEGQGPSGMVAIMARIWVAARVRISAMACVDGVVAVAVEEGGEAGGAGEEGGGLGFDVADAGFGDADVGGDYGIDFRV